jgi:hypothetical protein
MHHLLPRRGLLLVLGAVSLFVLGCGGKDGRPVLAKVSGTIQYKGKPLAGASISFLPQQAGIRSALGVTDEQGHYRLWTYDPDDGAPVGQHQVTISLRGPGQKLKLDPSVQTKYGAAYYEQLGEVGPLLIPAKYVDPKTSGFTAEVVAKRNNVFDFELVGEPPGKTAK